MKEAGRSVDINLTACITFDRIPLLGCCSFSTSPLLRTPIHHMSIINIVTMLPFCLSYPLSLSLSHTPFIFLTITSTFSLSLTLLSLHRSLFTFPVSLYAFLSLSLNYKIPGHALVMQQDRPFRGLASFGNNFLSKFEGAEVNSFC